MGVSGGVAVMAVNALVNSQYIGKSAMAAVAIRTVQTSTFCVRAILINTPHRSAET